jgi:hypothetical protein
MKMVYRSSDSMKIVMQFLDENDYLLKYRKMYLLKVCPVRWSG